MIKLQKNRKGNKPAWAYSLKRVCSVSPDYVGLQVTFGFIDAPLWTVRYWFKTRRTAGGKIIPAKTQLQRKVSYLVLKRLRNDYFLVRKCDYWGRAAVSRSIVSSRRPKQVRVRASKPKKPVIEWQQLQGTFDF